jgi:hypothetical protein
MRLEVPLAATEHGFHFSSSLTSPTKKGFDRPLLFPFTDFNLMMCVSNKRSSYSRSSSPEADEMVMETSSSEDSSSTTSSTSRRQGVGASGRRAARSAAPGGGSGNKKPRATVDHSYRDHYHDLAAAAGGDRKKKGPRGGVTTAFPEKLHAMLSSVQREGASHVVSWQPHGRCFLIHKKKEFVEDVMPR